MLLLVTSTLLQFKLVLSKRNSTVFLVQYLKAFGHITVAISCTQAFPSHVQYISDLLVCDKLSS